MSAGAYPFLRRRSDTIAAAGALAWVITPYLPGRWKIVRWATVAIVGFARIYLCAHNPLDVLGGLGSG